MAVTVLLYDMFKRVNRNLSFVAAIFSVAGFATGLITWRPNRVDVSIVCFGFYCVLIGYLILRSTFVPRFVGVMMAFAGFSWLTFLWPALGNGLYPYNLIPGLVGEGSLTLWLLVKGVNVQRWNDFARPVNVPIALILQDVGKPEVGTV